MWPRNLRKTSVFCFLFFTLQWKYTGCSCYHSWSQMWYWVFQQDIYHLHDKCPHPFRVGSSACQHQKHRHGQTGNSAVGWSSLSNSKTSLMGGEVIGNGVVGVFFWLCWVFVAAHGLSLVVASGGYSSLWHAGFSLRWLLLLQSTGSRHVGFSS